MKTFFFSENSFENFGKAKIDINQEILDKVPEIGSDEPYAIA